MIGGTWYVGDIYQVPLLCCRVIVYFVLNQFFLKGNRRCNIMFIVNAFDTIRKNF